MENRKRNIQMKFYVTEEEKRLIDEKMKQLPIKQYGHTSAKWRLTGISLSLTEATHESIYPGTASGEPEHQSNCQRANATGAVYQQDIEDIKKAVDEIWRLQRRTLLNQP